MAAVSAVNLNKSYESVKALINASFTVEEGALFGIIGADGAGKSTLMRMLVTLLRPDSGQASVLGRSILTDLAALRQSIGYMPQRFSLYQDLSVRENLLFFADIFGVASYERNNRMKQLLAFSKLAPFQNRRAGNLSGGMKQKLALSCALIHTPRALFLDEPTTGVDPVSRSEFWNILFELKRQGITIVVSTPYMDEATHCDALLFLHEGKIIEQGAPQKLLLNYPATIYKIKSSSGTSISISPNSPLPFGVELMYPSCGSLHLVVKDNFPGGAPLLSWAKQFAPNADRVEKVAPTIEDLLFLLINDRKAT